MEWQYALLLILGGLIFLMATGIPITFAFLITCMIGAYLFWGGQVGFETLVTSIYSSVASFVFLPLPLFILMGTIIFESGVGILMVDALDKLLGRVPGRLSLTAVAAGTVLASVTGVSTGSIAILGRALVPEMEKRGYSREMSIGPIVGSGQLATMIPPSALAVFLGAVGQISVGKLLIAIIMPGLLMASLFAAYIIIRCALQPQLAPNYRIASVSLSEKLYGVARHILPVGIIVFAVIGVMIIGVATPTEAAALGVVACYLLAAIERKLTWEMIKKSGISAIETTVMIFMIIAAAVSFSRLLSYSGAIKGVVNIAAGLPVAPIVIVLATQVVVAFMGMFMGPNSIIMITMPIFIPIIIPLGFDPVWFGVIMLINVQLALVSPPFGMDCYVMKGLSPPDVKLGDVFRFSMPFLGLGFLAIVIIMVFPQVALWLPRLMRIA
ncbi:MAG: TRAP transporter large permease subunit [Chloroflexi bacterium]|nr:TRAP transporter large permease subunit [Chloroflexota bacterium]